MAHADLVAQSAEFLRHRFKDIRGLNSRPLIYRLGGKRANLRTATTKSGDKYWFDVTPSLFEDREVEFFIYVCGSPSCMYVFPTADFTRMIVGASLGGQKQVPNFTLYLDRHVFEPAGRANAAHDITKYFNHFDLIAPSK